MSIISPRVRTAEKMAELLTWVASLREPNTSLKANVGVQSATLRGEKVGVGQVSKSCRKRNRRDSCEKTESSTSVTLGPRRPKSASVTRPHRSRAVDTGKPQEAWDVARASHRSDAVIQEKSTHSERKRPAAKGPCCRKKVPRARDNHAASHSRRQERP